MKHNDLHVKSLYVRSHHKAQNFIHSDIQPFDKISQLSQNHPQITSYINQDLD